MQRLQPISLGSDTPTKAVAGGFWRDASASFDEPRDSHEPRGSEYRPELATFELIGEVKRLLATERRVERLICLYLADLADRVRQGLDMALWAYADEFQAAGSLFGLGVRETRERVRVGRALRRLPEIEAAFVSGELSYSRVREVTRVAEPQTDGDWLALAQTLDMRTLERRVAAAREPGVGARVGDNEGGGSTGGSSGGGSGGSGAGERRHAYAPARTMWLSQNSLRLTLELSAEAWGVLERALEGARRSGAAPMSDAEAFAAVARDALAAQSQNPDASDPRRSVVVYECKSCAESALDTGVGLFELGRSAAATLCCGANEVDLASAGRVVQRGGPLPAAVRRAVMLRDHCRCRVPSCNRRRYVDVHHIIPQANGGEHSRRNCLVLCTTHHTLLHDGKLDVSGDADGQLSFRDAFGRPLVELTQQTPCRSDSHQSAPAGTGTSALDLAALDLAALDLAALDVSQPKAARHIGWDATQCGISLEPAERLLQVMGRRGGWSPDALIEKSGLSASAVSSALTLLELAGRVRLHDFLFDPV